MTPEQKKKIEKVQNLLGDAAALLDDLENDESFDESERTTFHLAWESAYEANVMLERFSDVGSPKKEG